MKITGALFRREALAGLSTFLASFYIVIVNPAILSQAGIPFDGAVTSTVLVCFFGSVFMGLYAKNPYMVAPGMGLNAFFTFTAVKGLGLSYEEALGAVFWSGIIFLFLALFGLREKVVAAVPVFLRNAISAGIGLFICFIGFQNAGFIVKSPATLVQMATFKDPIVVTFIVGLLLTAVLISKNVKGALVYGIVGTTLMSWPIGRWWGDASAVNFGTATLVNYTELLAMPDFSLLLKADILGSVHYSFLPVIFVFAFTDMFDSISTFMGLSEAAGLKDDEGNPRNMKKSLLVDSVTTLFSGLVGSSPGTAYIESAVGIKEGGRTGLTAIITGCLFLPLLFFSPLLSIIPSIASSIALVLVGAFMVKPLVEIDWTDYEVAIPAFLTLTLIPFSYSITTGIIFGFLSFTLLKIASGKAREIGPTLIIINLFSLLFLWL